MAKWRKDQQQFIDDMEAAGIPVVRNYSGRGSFGLLCPAVYVGGGHEVGTREVFHATEVRVAIDSMGKGVVIYVP